MSASKRTLPRRSCRENTSYMEPLEEMVAEVSSEEEEDGKSRGHVNNYETDTSSSSEEEGDSESEEDEEDTMEYEDNEGEGSVLSTSRITGTPNMKGKKRRHSMIVTLQSQRSLPASPASTSFTSTPMEHYNPESYLLAENRLKFSSRKKMEDVAVPNDARRGKKPRKGKRGLMGRKLDFLPERDQSNFSITKEAMKIASARATSLGGRDMQVTVNKHMAEIQNLLENKIKPDFPRWMSYMRKGFNVALHGFGSKIAVLDSFQEHLDSQGFDYVRINGLCRKMDTRAILTEFVEHIGLKPLVSLKGTNPDAISQDLCQQLPALYDTSFILITNFDSLALNNPGFVTAICNLATMKWIHILATTDNVNSGLGITQSQSIQLNLCWIPCSTFQPYTVEVSFLPHIFGDATTSNTSENALQYVLKSLTPNARKAFFILASLQLNKLKSFHGKKGTVEFIGVEFAELFRKCRDGFIAHQENVLRTLLVEFIDHKLITNHQGGKRRGVGNLLTINLEIDALEKIVKEG